MRPIIALGNISCGCFLRFPVPAKEFPGTEQDVTFRFGKSNFAASSSGRVKETEVVIDRGNDSEREGGGDGCMRNIWKVVFAQL